MNRFDIHERIFDFIIRVINYLNKLPKTPTNLVFINQATRSVTSMGANDQEADGTSSTKDFVHCYTLVRKESKETVFWLRIIGRTNPNHEEEGAALTKEGKEIVAIVRTIIKNTILNKR